MADMKRFIEVDAETGKYLGEWVGPDGDFTPMEGRLLVKKDADFPRPAAGATWDGQTFTAPATPPVKRVLRKGLFMDRFPLATQLAIETIAEQQTDAGRLIRIFTRRLEAEDPVDLDSPTLIERLQQLSAVLSAAQVKGWEDEAAAEASIAAILA